MKQTLNLIEEICIYWGSLYQSHHSVVPFFVKNYNLPLITPHLPYKTPFSKLFQNTYDSPTTIFCSLYKPGLLKRKLVTSIYTQRQRVDFINKKMVLLHRLLNNDKKNI